MDIEGLLRTALAQARRPAREAAAAWRAAVAGRKVVASLSTYFPIELCDALGLLHVPLAPEGEPAGSGPLPLCPTARSIGDLHQRGLLGTADLVVTGAMCRESRDLASLANLSRSAGAAQAAQGSPPVHLLRLPADDSPAARIAWRDELDRLGRLLAEVAGRRLEPLYLRAALHAADRRRELLAALDALRDRTPPALSFVEAQALARLANGLTLREHTDLLEAAVVALGQRAPATEAGRPRVLLAALTCAAPPLELLERLERARLHIAADNLLAGLRFPARPRPDGDPLEVLAESSRAMAAHLPLSRHLQGDTGEALAGRALDRRCAGVLFLVPEACDPAEAELSGATQALGRAGLGWLRLGYDPIAGALTGSGAVELERFVSGLAGAAG